MLEPGTWYSVPFAAGQSSLPAVAAGLVDDDVGLAVVDAVVVTVVDVVGLGEVEDAPLDTGAAASDDSDAFFPTPTPTPTATTTITRPTKRPISMQNLDFFSPQTLVVDRLLHVSDAVVKDGSGSSFLPPKGIGNRPSAGGKPSGGTSGGVGSRSHDAGPSRDSRLDALEEAAAAGAK